MSTVLDTDIFLVQRGATLYQVAAVDLKDVPAPTDILMAQRGASQFQVPYSRLEQVDDADLLLVQRGTTQHRVSGIDLKEYLPPPMPRPWTPADLSVAPLVHWDASVPASLTVNDGDMVSEWRSQPTKGAPVRVMSMPNANDWPRYDPAAGDGHGALIAGLLLSESLQAQSRAIRTALVVCLPTHRNVFNLRPNGGPVHNYDAISDRLGWHSQLNFTMSTFANGNNIATGVQVVWQHGGDRVWDCLLRMSALPENRGGNFPNWPNQSFTSPDTLRFPWPNIDVLFEHTAAGGVMKVLLFEEVLDLPELEKLEGWAAWDTGAESVRALRDNHPYKNARPVA